MILRARSGRGNRSPRRHPATVLTLTSNRAAAGSSPTSEINWGSVFMAESYSLREKNQVDFLHEMRKFILNPPPDRAGSSETPSLAAGRRAILLDRSSTGSDAGGLFKLEIDMKQETYEEQALELLEVMQTERDFEAGDFVVRKDVRLKKIIFPEPREKVLVTEVFDPIRNTFVHPSNQYFGDQLDFRFIARDEDGDWDEYVASSRYFKKA